MNKPLTNGTRVVVNGNREATIRSYDAGLDMYEVRLMDGCRFVGDIMVDASRIDIEENA